MNLNKEININKKFILIFILINIIALGLYYSYALFQVNVIKNNVIVINTGTVNLTVDVLNETNNTFTITKGTSKTVTVNLSSTSTSTIGYKLYYIPDTDTTINLTSNISFTDNIVEGTFTNSTSFTLTFNNTGDNDVTIILGGQSGLNGYSIELETGRKELKLGEFITMTGSEKVLKAVDNPSVSTCKTKVVEDGITYISGTKDCIDFNYVWYSGKLWRITAIYPDGSMKLVTEDAITAINWGSTVEYNGSWIYQWLNEDFYDTLVSPENVLIENAEWNYSTDENTTPVKPTTIATQKKVNADVGLLSAYEYAKAYANANTSTNYLNIGYYWWLITPYSGSYVRNVFNSGALSYNSSSSYGYGARPSIIFQSGISLTGSGTKNDPYKISGNAYSSASQGDLLNERTSGEYVNFDGDLYRIVSTENSVTKLTKVDYIRDPDSTATPKAVLSQRFSSNGYFGTTISNSAKDASYGYYWDYYLNNTWYNSISTTSKDMIIDGTFYLGLYANSNYKQTICKDAAASLDGLVTKLNEISSCTRYTSSDANKTFVGKVGLQRVGEMFSTQLGSGYSSSSNMWLITPYSGSYVRYIFDSGILGSRSPSLYSYGARPSIHLKSTIAITGGTGLEGDPYTIEDSES